MLRLLANEQVKDLPGDIRSFVRTHGEGSLSAAKLFVERTPKNPLCKKAALPPPLVFVFSGPDKKYKGVGAQSRNRLVAQVAEGTSSVYETPLCSGEQAAWETLGIFRSNLFESGAEEIAEENADTHRQLSRVKKELCVVSYEYGGYLPVEELARVSKFKPAAAPKALAKGAPKAAGKTDDLGIDFATGAPVVRSGADCDLPSGDCN